MTDEGKEYVARQDALHRLTYLALALSRARQIDFKTCGIEHLKDDVIGIADATEKGVAMIAERLTW